MRERISTTGYLSTKSAAEDLGVSQHQIAMLAQKREINSVKIEKTLLIDPFSLRQYKQIYRGKGRPLSPSVAWAALWLLSGLEVDWLSYQQRRRLMIKLHDITAPDLVWQCRKRAHLRLFKATKKTLEEVRTQIILSGKSTDRPDIFRMPPNEDEIEGYAPDTLIEELSETHNLYEDVTGNLLIHTLTQDNPPWPDHDIIRAQGERQLPVAAVAADLAASLDPREASAGISALEILLRGYRHL